MSARGPLLLLVGVALFLPQGAFPGQAGKAPERFVRPTLLVDKDDRVFARPAWVTTEWDPKADAPFRAAESETEPFRVGYFQDRSGKWPTKARAAHRAWRDDCQSAEKLHRACVYFDIARMVDATFGASKDDKRAHEELTLGWDVLRNPPRSYIFVRRGYGWNAGDGHRHRFGNLARALLKRNPTDRYVAHAAVGELMAEGLAKDPGFEQFLIDTLEGMRSSSTWSFLNNLGLMSIYEFRAFGTKRRSDQQKAIDYCDQAIKGAPKDYHGNQKLQEMRAELVRRMQYMKID